MERPCAFLCFEDMLKARVHKESLGRYAAIEEEVVCSRDALQRIAAAEEAGLAGFNDCFPVPSGPGTPFSGHKVP